MALCLGEQLHQTPTCFQLHCSVMKVSIDAAPVRLMRYGCECNQQHQQTLHSLPQKQAEIWPVALGLHAVNMMAGLWANLELHSVSSDWVREAEMKLCKSRGM